MSNQGVAVYFISVELNPSLKPYTNKGFKIQNVIDLKTNEVRLSPEPNRVFVQGIPNTHLEVASYRLANVKNLYRFSLVLQKDVIFKPAQTASTSINNPIDVYFKVDGSEPVGEEQLLFSGGFDSLQWGQPTAINFHTYITTPAIKTDDYGIPYVYNLQTYLQAKPFDASAVGAPTIVNINKFVTQNPTTTQTAYGAVKIYNLLQFVRPSGYNTSAYGIAYVQGGVKYLSPYGYDVSVIPKHLVINTTANQEVKPSGFLLVQQVPNPILSPRTIYPPPITSTLFGKPVATKTPMIEPLGINQATYGIATAWFRVRPAAAIGFDSFAGGYPLVFDPSQEVQTPSIITSAIFGDTAIRNERRFLQPTAIFEEVVEQWAIVTNTNRYYSPAGIDSQIYGNTAISNKTPSVFVYGISQTELGNAAVGYSIRTVAPSGFDRLLLGRPILTKTPELAPKSFNTSIVSSLFISHRIRTVRPAGFIATLFGSHVAWYRYRYVSSLSWSSSKFGAANLTHGVREVIAQGFVREVHGRLWISQGTRRIEPMGINNIYPSLHMVGGSREVKPTGFIATEFGTRIIPENIYAYPQGFAGTFGLSAIRLNTQYLIPLGFISVGQQPADRWGAVKAYNLTQYIIQVQNFDRDNGLIPPAWSEWTLIENRDKQLNVTGLNSLKVGYNKIDNNAAPLLPVGIAPPIGARYDVSMIAHGVRYIGIDGIAAPIVSDWLVIYNDARVINPTGFVDTRAGLVSAENTRRYYSGVGRFESLEAGVPMISYAIRHILLEPRYAIMPPQINLPTIDTWTKYATFRGFETAAYGTASLNITFNIVAPKWVYRDKVGDPYARNVTPEVKTYGHNSELFGVAGVRTQWRKLLAIGDALTLFGLARIADTKQVIDIRGWRSTMVAQKHTVTRTGAPPYSQQIISLDGWQDFDKDEYVSGFGISFDERRLGKRVPDPFVNQNVVYAKGFETTLFGVNKVHSNNIEIVSGIAIHNISSDHMVYNKTIQVVLTEENTIKSQVEVGKPRMSPWTIYAVNNAPAQAIDNHEWRQPHYVNSDGGYKPTGIIVGTPKVESTIRTITPHWYVYAKQSNHRVELVRRIIKPRSFGVTKMGLPSIPFTDQHLVVFSTDTKPSSLFGKPDIVIADRGEKYIKAIGLNELGIGRADIQLYTRELLAKGKDSLDMGTRKQNDKPYMWQGLRVGAHVPLIIGGDDMSAFGDVMVSLRIRGIELEGWESFISEYDTANFNKRMKVSHARQPDIQSQRITTDGFIATEYSNADIRFDQYFIRPDGNSNQFRKGGYHA